MRPPLATLRILDLTTLLPGPYATLVLADLGAGVVRVEAPGRPDLARLLPPFDADGVAAGHAFLNRNKRSLGLDLKAEGGVEIVKRLVIDGGYDIVVESARPGVMERLGVGYEALRGQCPGLIYASLSGYGQDGPYRERAGHDLNYLALAGLLAHHGRRTAPEPPAPLPTQVADLAGSLHLVAGILTAVIQRTATGEGARVDIALHDGALAWNALVAAHWLVGAEAPGPEATPLTGALYYDLYETSDGRLLSLGALEPKFWRRFCSAIARPDLVARGLDWSPAAQNALKVELRAIIRSKSLAEWTALFATTDACVEPVLRVDEALDHPQARARQMIVHVPRPAGKPQPQAATAVRLTGYTPEHRHVGPPLGAHTRDILDEINLMPDEIDALFDSGVVV